MKQQFFIVTILLALCLQAQSQQVFITKKGEVRFNASTPLEDIEAKNEEVNGIFRPKTGEVGAVLLIRDFHFPNKLMEEHFNENYIESETYPKATFRGRLDTFTGTRIAGNYPIKGQLTIRGISKEVSSTAKITSSGNGYLLTTEFIARPDDFDIKVPRLLFKKIAREVQVEVRLPLQPRDP